MTEMTNSLALPLLEETELRDVQFLLRPPRDGDIESLYQAVLESADQIRPWLSWYHPHYSRDDTARWINDVPTAWTEDRAYSFSILERATDELVGTIGINQLDRHNRRANLGYFVRTGATRRGVATAATKMLAQFGLTQLGLKRLEIVAAVGNYASQKVALKVGATREGIARRRSQIEGRQLDTVMFSLVAEDLARLGHW